MLGSVTGAILQGHNVVACEIDPAQFAAGKARLMADVNARLHMRAFSKLKLPMSQMMVHKDDVGKEAKDCRFLPHPRLMDYREIEDPKVPDPLKVFKDRCRPLKVILSPWRFAFLS